MTLPSGSRSAARLDPSRRTELKHMHTHPETTSSPNSAAPKLTTVTTEALAAGRKSLAAKNAVQRAKQAVKATKKLLKAAKDKYRHARKVAKTAAKEAKRARKHLRSCLKKVKDKAADRRRLASEPGAKAGKPSGSGKVKGRSGKAALAKSSAKTTEVNRRA